MMVHLEKDVASLKKDVEYLIKQVDLLTQQSDSFQTKAMERFEGLGEYKYGFLKQIVSWALTVVIIVGSIAVYHSRTHDNIDKTLGKIEKEQIYIKTLLERDQKLLKESKRDDSYPKRGDIGEESLGSCLTPLGEYSQVDGLAIKLGKGIPGDKIGGSRATC